MSVPQLPKPNRRWRRASAAQKRHGRTFEHFLRSVLKVDESVTLTAAQWVLIRVCFDDIDPIDLPDSDRAIALELFGSVDRIPLECRHVLAVLKGARIGGIAVSEKHANFLVNMGGGTASDVRALIAHIQERVRAETGHLLEPEISFIGEF